MPRRPDEPLLPLARPAPGARALLAALVALFAVVLSPGGRALAQQRDGGDKAAAEALFDHAKSLYNAGRYAEACPKFAESQRLDAGVGTLLYLADCYAHVGRTASAWAGFREAAAAAKTAGQTEREKIARDRAAELEPGLSKLTILVAPSSEAAGAQVSRNGVLVGKVLWGTAFPVDPGVHTIEATAPGRKRWTTRIEVGERAASVSVNVPALELAPAAPPSPRAPAASTDAGAGRGQRAVGLVLGGLGVVGCAVGAGFGIQAMSKDGDAADHCRGDDPTRCDARGVELGAQAHDAATFSTIAFGAGAAALAAGVVVFVTAPSPKGASRGTTARLAIAPRVGPGAGGLAVGGSF